jgi:hypothetical protein
LGSEKEKRELYFFKIIVIASGIVTAALALYVAFAYVNGANTIVGDNLVNTSSGTPLEFPPPSISPVYVKPATILYASTIVFIVSLMSLVESSLLHVKSFYISLGFVVFFLAASLCLYEVLFNFSLWNTVMTQQIQSTGRLNPDSATNVYPIGKYAINLAFATKVFTSAFIAFGFVTFIFWRTLTRKERAILP